MKTEVIYCCHEARLQNNASSWRLDEVHAEATVTVASSDLSSGGLTLGMAIGSAHVVEEQLRQKAKVVAAMQEEVGICQDAQIEQVICKQSL